MSPTEAAQSEACFSGGSSSIIDDWRFGNFGGTMPLKHMGFGFQESSCRVDSVGSGILRTGATAPHLVFLLETLGVALVSKDCSLLRETMRSS